MAELKEPHEQIPERLLFRKRSGWYRFGRIPYKIRYVFGDKTSDDPNDVGEHRPARFMLTPDSHGGDLSLSIWIHESVPQKFEDVVMFHELREAELQCADSVNEAEAHMKAVLETKEYAKKHLSDADFIEFMEWDKKFHY